MYEQVGSCKNRSVLTAFPRKELWINLRIECDHSLNATFENMQGDLASSHQHARTLRVVRIPTRRGQDKQRDKCPFFYLLFPSNKVGGEREVSDLISLENWGNRADRENINTKTHSKQSLVNYTIIPSDF
jgi:hypothetical protein